MSEIISRARLRSPPATPSVIAPPEPSTGVRSTQNHRWLIGRSRRQRGAVEILESFPPVRGLVFGSTAAGASREVGVLIEQAASSAAQRHWRSLGTRSVNEARAFMVSVMRRRVSFAAAMAHARLRLSRLERIGHAGRIAGRGSGVVAPFLSQTVWEQHARGPLGGGSGRAGFMGPGAD